MQYSLVGDIGGTHARFALIQDTHELQRMAVLNCSDFEHPRDAILQYLESAGITQQHLKAICLAIAGDVGGDSIDMLNNHWSFKVSELQQALGVDIRVINDFTAQALCLDTMNDSELCWMGAARPKGNAIRIVMGPGTGLGLAAILPNGSVLPSEGGHIGFSPTSAHQVALLQALWERFGRVSAERVLSGRGLENLFWANAKLHGSEKRLQAADITALAHSGNATATQAVADLLDILACTAGDMALAFWARDGVYLTGGVLEKLSDFIDAQWFRERFEDKGRLKAYCADVPIAIIRAEQPGLRGCAEALLSGRSEVA